MTSAHSARIKFRDGSLNSHTSNMAPGHIQANLLVLSSAAAKDFHDLCARNPVPCPLLGTSLNPGDPFSFNNPSLFSHEVDIRTDVPKYNIYQSGKLIGTKPDIRDEWTEDHVAFLIGCSFSFESALGKVGLPPRHWEEQEKGNVSMYRTNRKLLPAGRFTNATHVVSMRPYLPTDVEKVREVTRPFLKMHGEPIAWGWDAMKELGIEDIEQPDFGDAVTFREGEIPVFWGCGVTPQVAVMEAGSKIKGKVMGHAPGHMVILDMTECDMSGNVQQKKWKGKLS